MATIKLYTRSISSDILATVWIRFTDGRKTNIRITTPYRLVPDYWNEEKQTLKQRILYSKVFSEDEAKDIEDKFTQLKDVILREHFKLSGPATKDWLKGVIDKFYYKQVPGTENLNQYIKRFVDEAASGKRLCFSGNTKKAYSAGTLRSYRDFQRSFNLYQGIEKEPKKDKDGKPKKKRKPTKDWPKQPYKPLDFNDITVDFYNSFMKFFYDRDCGANYVGKHIKTIKTIMRQSRDEGLHNNTEVERKVFKAISEPSESIYLTEVELSSLLKLDLSGSESKHLDIARDVFLCGCYTAQRYSDYSRISNEMIKEYSGNRVIELIQQKTGEKCIVPIRPELDFILKKYNYSLPKTYEQKINKYIKEIGEKAKIAEFVHFEQNKGGLTVKRKIEKFKLIKPIPQEGQAVHLCIWQGFL